MEKLAFNEHFEKHFVNHMLRDSDFLLRVYEDVTPELFSNELVQRAVRLAREFAVSEKAAPNTLVFHKLDRWLEQKFITKELFDPLNKFLDELFTYPLQNRNFLLSEFTRFVRHQKFKTAMLPAMEQVKQGKFDEAENLLKEVFTYKPTAEDDLGKKFIADPSERILRRSEEDHERLWTLIPEIDREVQGLSAGELGVWQSQRSSAGKSAAMIHLARSSVFQGKKIIFYSLEMSEESIEDRLDMNIAGLNKDGLLDRSAIQAQLTKMFRFGGDIWIKKFPMYLTRVSDLRRHKQQIEKLYDYHADAVLVDYGDLIAPETRSITGDLYATGAEVYGHLAGWATEEQFVCWTAMQSNRSGMEATHADQEHASGSIAKMQIADLVLSINRTAEEHRQGLTRVHVVKNREGRARFDISFKTDFSKMHFWVRAE